ncbi:3-phosphoshikimate 1-carboxyvinyltransferase [Flavobacteriaceae bacterium]|nr:3-phosphoshikimate 1-carboxyvinyltransferase [Flavobacteriaceae bacterium]
MVYQISKEFRDIEGSICISGSKSESNRLLLLRAYTSYFKILNLSDSDDTKLMISAIESDKEKINVGHAGTAMRFLTAYFSSITKKSKVLTGSDRMRQRPISILVDALKDMGCDIEYLEKRGFPPLKINGKNIQSNSVSLSADVSSQYISSLMMLGVSLENGLEIILSSKITSLPYILMTKKIIERIGGVVKIQDAKIFIEQFKEKVIPEQFVESDWSSASYFFSIAALSESVKLTLSKFSKDSLQGDSKLIDIYKKFGVRTIFEDENIILKKNNKSLPKSIHLNLIDNPDIAQTILITCLGLGIDCTLIGLHTLKIKETDRLVALKNEIEKFEVDKIEITGDSITLENNSDLKHDVTIDTYNDHRMAMSFAPLSLLVPINIKNPEVVTKSYFNFWNDLESLGFNILKK